MSKGRDPVDMGLKLGKSLSWAISEHTGGHRSHGSGQRPLGRKCRAKM